MASNGDCERARMSGIDDKPLHLLTQSESISVVTRDITPLEIASVGWSICNSWVGVLSTLAFNVTNGGSPGLLYGLWFVFIMYGFVVYTLAELARVYPSAGGQYHWTAVVAPKWCARAMSYACGMINIFAWASLSAGVAIILPQQLLALVITHNPSYEVEPWHVFLMYQFVCVVCLLHNIFSLRRTMWLIPNDMHGLNAVLTLHGVVALSLAAFIAATVASLARAPHFQSSKAVWITFVDLSGWDNKGLVFFIGLLTPGYMYAGIDGAIHLAEEARNARTAVPKALVSIWGIGFVTSFIVAVASMYSVQDFTAVATTKTGFPVFELWRQAMDSEAAATAFLVFTHATGYIAVAGCQQTASRLTWSFARDSGLVASSKIARIDGRWQVPVWALYVNGVMTFLIGCVYLGSSTAFNAFIGTGLILQLVTFAFPAALLLLTGRPKRFLPPTRTFGLPSAFGWVANVFTVAFALFCLVFYCFPPARPVTASNMNYAPAVLVVIGIFIVANWFLHARKHYHGPQLEDLVAL
ncbi:hypothetical protein COCC4DRAFT_62273 [Bipolaris maydis ATCC 48331]|uniref:Amino acid permease/ SLC12A domain-containing protein n=2 Tax=Cochliobolus heterostrophus TaxID=5016 RepID=M2TH58_COCH5|nr:uncharacterized protein COCC4DRAFT_62273 [Bipolaris maydis ATCC 48331]EMD96775.1 hypothetical protein COCHEDRAFT_1150460 [Bipolaris maydis C5]KAJ5031341.1 amino acid/polyamine transporter I [Bipolaris maydis]ENI03642.1 hypothetical protein COCC4DRAFT_62273 [Bipolaris maydis ATCC 48331]KAJ6273795.1 amino acid/polyamine transporter I [Bipolaris maydis]KAJ6285014.1 amino acid/polyamine transporter I [Bipolaris maydis]